MSRHNITHLKKCCHVSYFSNPNSQNLHIETTMNKNKTRHTKTTINRSKAAHTQKQEVQDPRSFIELHHPKKHMNKLNNIRRVGLGHALAHLKKMMRLMHSTTCQVQPCVKFSLSWLLEPAHTNNNKQEQGCTQNNDEQDQDHAHTKARGT